MDPHEADRSPRRPPTSLLAVVSLVCAFLCSPVGFVLGVVAWIRIRRSRGSIGGGGWALAGLVLGALLSLAELLVFILVMAAAVIPFYWLGPMAMNEESARRTLGSIANREEEFRRETGRYGDLAEILGESAADTSARREILAGLDGPDSAKTGAKCGYAFVVHLDGKGGFVAYAWPLRSRWPGWKTFAVSSAAPDVRQRRSPFEGRENPPAADDFSTNPDWAPVPVVRHSDWDWD
jgi:hypothetical protein